MKGFAVEADHELGQVLAGEGPWEQRFSYRSWKASSAASRVDRESKSLGSGSSQLAGAQREAKASGLAAESSIPKSPFSQSRIPFFPTDAVTKGLRPTLTIAFGGTSGRLLFLVLLVLGGVTPC